MKTKIWTAVLSFAIAFSLWLYVVSVVSPNSEKTFYNIPVVLQNESLLEERGLMITSTDLPKVSLRLEGNRTDLDKLNSSNITVVANVSSINEAGEHKLTYTVTFPGDIPNNAITIQKRTPDNVGLVIEERISKSVPVEVVYTGTQADGFSVDKQNIVLSDREIQITGPKRFLDQVARARVIVNLQGRKESITNMALPYSLVNDLGEVMTSNLVEDGQQTTGIIMLERLRIVRVKTVELKVEVVNGGGATDKTSQVTVSPQFITISGSEKQLASIGDTLYVDTVELGELKEDTTYVIALDKFLADMGIECESGETTITVDVKFPDLIIKSVYVTDIKLVNTPSNMSAEVITKVCEVNLRGPKELIDKINSGRVQIQVDMTDAQPGTETKPGILVLPVGFEEIGAVNMISISVTAKRI